MSRSDTKNEAGLITARTRVRTPVSVADFGPGFARWLRPLGQEVGGGAEAALDVVG